ncbi:MAG: NADH-quinone oxidoreductase subunit C [Candidatus Binataceae bacterium]
MLIDSIRQRFGADVLAAQSAHGNDSIVVDRDRAPQFLRALRDEPDFCFESLADLTAVDWPDRNPRFDVVYQLKSLTKAQRLRVKIRVAANDPWVHSATGLWKSADWLERECYDMFGIEFRGHPDLRRILMYDEFQGHPLRKDYPVMKRQPLVPETDPVIHPLRRAR